MSTTTTVREVGVAAWRRRPSTGALVNIGVPLIIGVAIGLPIFFLVLNSFNVSRPADPPVYSLQNWITAFGHPATYSTLWTTFTLGVSRTLIGLALGVAFAWLIARTDMPGGSILEFFFRLTFFIPTLATTLGFILLLDPNYGLVNAVLAMLPLPVTPVLNIYSFWGIVWVHLAGNTVALYVFLLTPIFRRMSATLEEAARVSGAAPLTVLRRITMPILAPGVLAVGVLVFVRALEAFEVELLLGRPAGIWVYSTQIYNYIRDDIPRFGLATALGSIFLIIMLVLAISYRAAIAGRDYTTIAGRGFSTARTELGRMRYPALALCIVWILITLAAPLIFLILGSFMRRYGFFYIPDPFTMRHWQGMLADPVFLTSLQNTLIIATAVSIGGTLIYSLVAYYIIRWRGAGATTVDILAWMPWAVPGILMSLGLLWLFLGTPLRTLLYGTLFGIIVAMIIRDSPLSTALMKAAVLQIGKELEESASASGAGWFTMYRRILVPLLAPAALTVIVLQFASAVRDISTPVLLYSHASRPLSILLLEYSLRGDLERAAALAVIVLIIVSAASIIGQRLSTRYTN